MTFPAEGSAAPAQNEGSLFENLIEVLYAPAKVFERCRNASWFKYAAVVTVIAIVLVIALKGLFTPFIDAQFELGIKMQEAKGKTMPPQATGETARNVGAWITLIIFGLIPLFSAIFAGLFLWLGAKIIGVRLTYAQAAFAYAVTGLTTVVGYAAMAVQGIMVTSESVRSMMDGTLSLARFFDPLTTSPALLGLLGRIDLIGLWNLALVGIGVSVIARVSRANGFIAAGIGWAITALATLAFSVATS